MPSPSSDPTANAAITRCADELQSLRASVDGLAQRLGALTAENATLRAHLEHSEAARRDLVAQVEHVIELLAQSRRQLRELQPQQPPTT